MNSEKVSVDEIRLDHRMFKISRDEVTARFSDSVRELGVLEPVDLLRTGDGLVPVFGINRIETAAACGGLTVPALVHDRIDHRWYMGKCVLKADRNETGPIGRLRALTILRAEAPAGDPDLLCRHLGIPRDFISDQSLCQAIFSMPADLLRYIDAKDIGFKIIRAVLSLPAAAQLKISLWASDTGMSVNAFRKTVEMVSEILRRDGNLDSIMDGEVFSGDDRNTRAEMLIEEITRRRFPEYTALHDRVEGIRKRLSRRGFGLDFPRYFEGERFKISVEIHRRSRPEELRRTLESLPFDLIGELQHLL